jgi:hypothetical protein
MCLILPILLPINNVGGKSSNPAATVNSTGTNVAGLNTVAWGNVAPQNTSRYWAHLIMAIVVIVWFCWVCFAELKVYIRVRQDYLTSAEHRLRASATTVLVSAIPKKWLSEKALMGLFDVFPGGIRNIWINRNYDTLLTKIHEREDVLHKLELAETVLIQKCKKAQMKQSAQAEKKQARKMGAKAPTKEERQAKQKQADEEANIRAQGEGVSAGDPHQIKHTLDEVIDEEEGQRKQQSPERSRNRFPVPVIGAVGQGIGRGLGRGFGAIGGLGQTLVGGVRNVGRGLDEQLEFNNGFVPIDSPETPAAARFDAAPTPATRQTTLRQVETTSNSRPIHNAPLHDGPTGLRKPQIHNATTKPLPEEPEALDPSAVPSSNEKPVGFGLDGTIDDNSDHWLKFWKGPAVGYPSPKPHGYGEESDPFFQTNGGGAEKSGSPEREEKKTIWGKITGMFKHDKPAEVDYPPFFNPDYKEDVPGGALWEQYIKRSDRPTHRLPRFGIPLLPTLPFINKKVDTIYWCREQLARLNVEIEEDQQHPERYPLMNSAFIQFNHQVAAHMACQAVAYHIPKQMAPRIVEISPTDVIWENMSIKWWEAWLRTGLVVAIVAGMTLLWAFPVAGTALLGNLPALIEQVPWLAFLNNNPVVRNTLQALGGVLPPLALAILLAIVPLILYYLATVQGVQTGMQKELTVQNYLFFFNFVQVFLVVSIATSALKTIQAIALNPASIPMTLATSLPAAANYFFSYMILQALGNSSGALLQYGTLILWFIISKFFDKTARDKWKQNTNLSVVNWGSYFPLYTTFACIGLIYSVIAPMILVFSVITFSLYWIANRYCMLYIYKNKEDTGGLLYPRAINQTFVGIYFMELCLIGLFFIARDQNDNLTCTPQAIIMIIMTAVTGIFQYLLSKSFSPLFRHLPITLEDEAVLRDEAFARAQAARWEREDAEDEAYENVADAHNTRGRAEVADEDIEMKKLSRAATSPNNRSDPRTNLLNPKTWTAKGTTGGNHTSPSRSRSRSRGAEEPISTGDPFSLLRPRRRRHRSHHKDLESQKRIGAALFGSTSDEIEDLTPHERDVLITHAFKHSALRARRPTVWIPRDEMGVSDEEVRRTEEYSGGRIWISNEGTALDGLGRVVYGRNPPDWSGVEGIKL